jgi:tetratricopeptide (TPR) repeat protein
VADKVNHVSVQAQLERILASSLLESAHSLRRLLQFVVEETLAGRAGHLKEYSLGVEVFSRGDTFDPRLDPIVRVQARNLRARLAQYYDGPGVNDSVVIELPKRTYVPVFRVIEEDAAGESPVADPPVPETQLPETPLLEPPVLPMRPAAGRMAQSMAAVVLLALCAVVFWPLHMTGAGGTPHSPDPRAQDLYIRGRYSMDRQTEPALRESIACFERAIAIDPRFAAAYTGLADAHNILAQYGYISPAEGMRAARQAAQRALAIDPTLAEAHVSLAAVMEAYDWNWAGAEREYRRALELNPWLATAHLWYGMFLRDQGRLKEGLAELRRAAQVEPFSVMTSINIAQAFLMDGHYAEAAEEARHAAQVAPELVTAQLILSRAYHAESRYAESDAALSRALSGAAGNPHALAAVACALAKHGGKEESLRLVADLERLAQVRYVSPYDLGTVSLALGDEDRALSLFREAYRQRSSGLIFLRYVNFTSLARAAEFHSLVAQIHPEG